MASVSLAALMSLLLDEIQRNVSLASRIVILGTFNVPSDGHKTIKQKGPKALDA